MSNSEIELARRDLEAYARMLPENAVSGMIAIEQRHGLYGYPPTIVMQGLAAKAEGKDMDRELDRLLGGSEEADKMSHSVLSKNARQRTRRKQISMAGLWLSLTKEIRRGTLIQRTERRWA